MLVNYFCINPIIPVCGRGLSPARTLISARRGVQRRLPADDPSRAHHRPLRASIGRRDAQPYGRARLRAELQRTAVQNVRCRSETEDAVPPADEVQHFEEAAHVQAQLLPVPRPSRHLHREAVRQETNAGRHLQLERAVRVREVPQPRAHLRLAQDKRVPHVIPPVGIGQVGISKHGQVVFATTLP